MGIKTLLHFSFLSSYFIPFGYFFIWNLKEFQCQFPLGPGRCCALIDRLIMFWTARMRSAILISFRFFLPVENQNTSGPSITWLDGRGVHITAWILPTYSQIPCFQLHTGHLSSSMVHKLYPKKGSFSRKPCNVKNPHKATHKSPHMWYFYGFWNWEYYWSTTKNN